MPLTSYSQYLWMQFAPFGGNSGLAFAPKSKTPFPFEYPRRLLNSKEERSTDFGAVGKYGLSRHDVSPGDWVRIREAGIARHQCRKGTGAHHLSISIDKSEAEQAGKGAHRALVGIEWWICVVKTLLRRANKCQRNPESAQPVFGPNILRAVSKTSERISAVEGSPTNCMLATRQGQEAQQICM